MHTRAGQILKQPCPSSEDLSAFNQGNLPEQALERVALHLSVCQGCESTVQGLMEADDPFLSSLRESAREQPFVHEPECQQLEDRALSIPFVESAEESGREELSPRFPAAELEMPQGLLGEAIVQSRQGEYRLLEKLGRGGMGVVYKAWQPGLNRLVALKRILAGSNASPKELARFRAEARKLARVQHVNIVQVHEIGQFQGCPFFAMEFVEGGSLADKLSQWSPTFEQSAELMETVARALHHAHQKGIIHRDIKPANILLTRDGIPKLGDFGLAMSLGKECTHGDSFAVAGTPPYMAPEQVSPTGTEVGPATDVYGLGATLYELLTGQPPFRAATPVETVRILCLKAPVRPSHHVPKLPRDLETICLKCLEKESDARYRSALELADDLRRFLQHEPVKARPVGRAEALWRWCRRNPVIAFSSGLAAAGLIAATALSIVIAQQSVRSAANVGAALTETRRSNARLECERGLSLCEQGDVGLGILWLARSLQDAPADAEDIRYLAAMNVIAWSPSLADATATFAHPQSIRAAALSPNGKLIVIGGEDGRAQVWDASTGMSVGAPLLHQDAITALAFSPDGQSIATGGLGKRVQLWNTTSHKPIGRPLEHPGAIYALAFDPSGRSILTACVDRTARLWDLTGQKACVPLSGHTAGVRAVAFSPDGKLILTGSLDRTARLWRAESGQPLGQAFVHDSAVSSVAFAPNSKTMVTVAAGTAKLWDATSGASLRQVFTHLRPITAVAFGPDHDTILTGCADGTAQRWSMATGQPLGAPLMHRGQITTVGFTRDGRTLLTASTDMTAKLWHIGARGEQLALLPHLQNVTAVAVSPDGKTVLTGSFDGTARLWDMTTGNALGKPLEQTGKVLAVALSPDGQSIVTAGSAEEVRLWDLHSGAIRHRLSGHRDWVTCASFSPDGTKILTAGCDGTAVIWHADSGTQMHRLEGHKGGLTCATFSPDGMTILTAGEDGSARIWDVATGCPVVGPLVHEGKIRAAVFSPDGLRVLTGSEDRRARLWDARTGILLGANPQHQSTVSAVAFSPDGRALLTGSEDHTARLWDAETGLPLGAPLLHHGRIQAVAFSPDGKIVATGSEDRTARLWDRETRMPIGPRLTHLGSVSRLTFTPDGGSLVTGDDCHDARIWKVPVPVERDVARTILRAQLFSGRQLEADHVLRELDSGALAERRQQLEAGGN